MSSFEDFSWYIQGEKRFSRHTVDGYLSDLRFWVSGGLDLEKAQPPGADDVRQALTLFEAQGLKPATLARRSASLRLYVKFRALRASNWESVLKEIPLSRLGDSFPKALTVADVCKLLDFDPGKEPEKVRDRALMELLYACGLRVSEAVDLKITQIDRRAGLLRVLGKGRKERIVPYTERAGEWLERYLEDIRPQWSEKVSRRFADSVFLSRRLKSLTRMAVWKILHKRALECGLSDVHPHILRHSFATHLLQGGADIRFVQALLGHASLGTTERYIKIADEELRKIFDDIHPLQGHSPRAI